MRELCTKTKIGHVLHWLVTLARDEPMRVDYQDLVLLWPASSITSFDFFSLRIQSWKFGI